MYDKILEINERLIVKIKDFAEDRKKDIARGAETPRLAACFFKNMDVV